MKPVTFPSELLSRPGAWCQGTACRDSTGRPCEDKKAVSWCIIGALIHCFPKWKDRAKRHEDLTRVGVIHKSDWNDARGRTQAEVVAMLKECGL
jgi:hypothetical protein